MVLFVFSCYKAMFLLQKAYRVGTELVATSSGYENIVRVFMGIY